MTTFYLGGPMRGYDRYNFPAFDRAAEKLRWVADYVILSPAEHDRETGFDETANTLDGFDFEAAFAWDLASIEQATGGVIFLPGWERSGGCAAEYAHARSLGRTVYAYRDACDDPDAPYGFKLDVVPIGYTPEVDPLDPANPEPHVVEVAGGRVLADGESIHGYGRDVTVLRVAEPLPVTKHILDAADPEILDDGFGNRWEKCGPYCGLQIVRPGNVQCDDDCCYRGGTGYYSDLEVDSDDTRTPDEDREPLTGSCWVAALPETIEAIERGWYPSSTVTSADGETRVVDPDTGGVKATKIARFDLIPAGPLWQLAEHYGKGARKYDDDNWRRGYSWRLSFAALMRHAWAFWRGETYDPETGSHHMTAVAWHAMALVEFTDTHPEKDDRPTPERAE